MKIRTITLLGLLFAFSFSSIAQKIEIAPMGGYTFGDRFNFDLGYGKLSDGPTYGGAVTFALTEYNALELSYSRQEAHAMAYSLFYNIDVYEPISVNYICLGGYRLLPFSDKAEAFGGIKAGVGIISSNNNNFSTITRFATGVDLGVKYYFTETVGIRLQANLNFPITNLGASLWWSSGSGTSVGVSTYAPIVQFGFNGGLVFVIK